LRKPSQAKPSCCFYATTTAGTGKQGNFA